MKSNIVDLASRRKEVPVEAEARPRGLRVVASGELADDLRGLGASKVYGDQGTFKFVTGYDDAKKIGAYLIERGYKIIGCDDSLYGQDGTMEFRVTKLRRVQNA